MHLQKIESLDRAAAIAPWFSLRRPSCGPGFESQTHHLFLKKGLDFYRHVIQKHFRPFIFYNLAFTFVQDERFNLDVLRNEHFESYLYQNLNKRIS